MNLRVCYPVLETETIKYSVQPGTGFLDEGYYRATHQVHSGADFNAVTGGDSDYGNKVRAAADGVVVSAGQYPSWGGIVLIHHPSLGVWTQYAHLINICVRAGQTVSMGDQVGQIGKGANNQFYAHLHFEVRRDLLPAQFWASSRFPTKAGAEQYIREHYLDPEVWLAEHQALTTLAQVEAVRQPIVTPAQAAPTAPTTRQIYAHLRDPDGTPRTDAVSITVDAQGRLMLGADNQPRAYYMTAEIAAAKGVK